MCSPVRWNVSSHLAPPAALPHRGCALLTHDTGRSAAFLTRHDITRKNVSPTPFARGCTEIAA